MEVDYNVIAKRLWNLVRVAFFMIRKELVSKRKFLIMDMNLLLKKGKLLRKSLSNLMSPHHHHHHHHHSRCMTRGSFGLQEYEFSCSNSPIPVFSHLSKRKHHYYFPCINFPEVIQEEEEEEEGGGYDYELEPEAVVALVPKTPEYTFNFLFDAEDLAPGGEKRSSPLQSPFSVRVSDYSSEDESDTGDGQVDDDAEEFIRRFYEQLRNQSRVQLLH